MIRWKILPIISTFISLYLESLRTVSSTIFLHKASSSIKNLHLPSKISREVMAVSPRLRRYSNFAIISPKFSSMFPKHSQGNTKILVYRIDQSHSRCSSLAALSTNRLMSWLFFLCFCFQNKINYRRCEQKRNYFSYLSHSHSHPSGAAASSIFLKCTAEASSQSDKYCKVNAPACHAPTRVYRKKNIVRKSMISSKIISNFSHNKPNIFPKMFCNWNEIPSENR